MLVTSLPHSRRHPPASRGLSSGSYSAQQGPATSYPFCPGGRWQLLSGIALLRPLEQSLLLTLWPAGKWRCRILILSTKASSTIPVWSLWPTSSQCRGIVPRQRETSSSFKRILLRLGNKYNQSYEGKDKQLELTLGELAQAGCGVTESLASASGGVGGGWTGRRLKSIISTPQNLSCSDDV